MAVREKNARPHQITDRPSLEPLTSFDNETRPKLKSRREDSRTEDGQNFHVSIGGDHAYR
jgi:hypothetical protein